MYVENNYSKTIGYNMFMFKRGWQFRPAGAEPYF